MKVKLRISDAGPAGGRDCVVELIPEPSEVFPENIVLRVPSPKKGARAISVRLEQGNLSQRLVAAPDRASLNNAVEQSLTVGLLIPAELLGPLDLFDRSLLGLLTFNGEKPMTPGRLAYLLSDHFDNVSVNRVLERLTAIGSHFESNGRGSLLAGDPRGGYLVRV